MTISNTLLGLTDTDIFVSVGSNAVSFLSLCNTSAAPVIVNMYVVPTGQATDLTRKFLHNLEIKAGDTFILYQASEKIITEDGDKFVATADSASVVAALVSYIAI